MSWWDITKAGDANPRRTLCQAVTFMMLRACLFWLRTWVYHDAKQRGRKEANVALTRRNAVVLHLMWRDGTSFDNAAPPVTAYTNRSEMYDCTSLSGNSGDEFPLLT
ncbi:hypothetical protein RUM8411_01014 [Ruegeria meonggei]|uniref:Transposase IS116/IS110/IS902 family protein n=1 Tax=Ruegeria meonggei TaxID=1446476 RepID=A0A1X6YMN8_9RHOB|nr:hypothetical protein RUM8411_01014 [Ruegeria meonggei]